MALLHDRHYKRVLVGCVLWIIATVLVAAFCAGCSSPTAPSISYDLVWKASSAPGCSTSALPQQPTSKVLATVELPGTGTLQALWLLADGTTLKVDFQQSVVPSVYLVCRWEAS